MHEPDTTVGDNGAPRSPITPIHDHDDLPPLPAHHAEPLSPIAAGRPSQDEAAKKAVQDVLYSDIGVNTLLNRLKQSIASVKDFASFLKKRSSTEDEHAKDLRRLCRATHQDIRQSTSRQGTYSRQFEALTNLHERMAENGLQFALNLHQMHEDLTQLAFEMEKGRKNWKSIGLNAEAKAADAEKQLQKAKERYETLAEQYDHARTGDGGRHFGLKGMKSAEQREEELKGKVDMADKDYQSKVQYARQTRQELLSTSRPQAVKAVEDLISECDAGLTLQMQKFATFNERLMLGNGLLVSPLNEPSGPKQHSMRELVGQIDNQQDFQSYIRSFGTKIPPRSGDIEYRQHPSLAPKGAPYKPPVQESQPQSSFQPSYGQPPPPQKDVSPVLQSPTTPYGTGAVQQPQHLPSQAPPNFPMQQYGAQLPEPQTSSTSPQLPHGGFDNNSHRGPPGAPDFGQQPSGLYGEIPSQHQGPPPVSHPPPQSTSPGYSGAAYPGQQAYGAPPPPAQPQPQPYTGAPTLPPVVGLPSDPRPRTREGPSGRQPAKPVFGLSLNELFLRDQSPVPLVVYQCIQAVDVFGLDHEGIYRIPGNQVQVQELRTLFNGPGAEKIDFLNPTSFHHDVNNAAHLLKLFFRELSDPLFTGEHYQGLIAAAKISDDTVRRDTLHSIINALPDPNYATLRALTLHLGRVVEHREANRMTAGTLSIIFAPTLMGPHHGDSADASWQPKVIETVLQNALQIFDED